MRHKTNRPLLRTNDPRATLTALYEARVPIYALADLCVEARADYSVEVMAEQVIATLQTRPDVLERK